MPLEADKEVIKLAEVYNIYQMNLSKIAYFCASLLFLGIFYLPYTYYIFLRWVICSAAALLAYDNIQFKTNLWTTAFVLIALVFNPIFPLYLNKSIWVCIDVVTMMIFIYAANPNRRKIIL